VSDTKQSVNRWRERAKDVIVLILGGGRGSRLDPLTRLRAKPAVPFAGKYRLIDIPISNAIHSDMERMFVLTQYNSVSLHRHIAWTYRFDAFSRGFVQILAAQQTFEDEHWFQGTADAVRQNAPIVSDMRGDLVLILSGDHLYRMDYRDMLRDHVGSRADITVAVLPCSSGEIGDFGAVRVDETGRIVEFREKPKTPEARAGMQVSPVLLEKRGVATDRPYLASMGVYLFRKEALLDYLDNDFSDFGHHVMPHAVDRCRVQAHLFDGYWRDIGTIRAFYDAHMDLVQPDAPFDFHDRDWPIFTHPRYLPGSRLTDCRFHRTVLAGGAIVSDCHVENSVIGVRAVMRQATVRGSLIMGSDPFHDDPPPGAPPVGIGRGSVIESAIIDKNVHIGENVRIVNEAGLEEAEGKGYVIREGIVVVPHNTVIPDGTVI
jgi:glucose-1-phosphate adenylyltransferase